MRLISLQPLTDRMADSRELRDVLFVYGGKLYRLAQVENLPAGTAGETYGATERAMLQAVYDKVNALLARIKEP